MIVRPRPNMLQIFFILRGSIVPRILGKILVVGLLSSVIVLAHRTRPGWLPTFDGAPFAVLGIALSIFLGFRNNACYDRWWEARRQWGALIVTARDFARQSLVLEREEERRHLLTLAMAFAQSLVLHLRPGCDPGKVARLLTAEDQTAYSASCNPPDAILRRIGAGLARLLTTGQISDQLYQTFDRTVSDMAMVQASCERIRTTPIPFGYTLLLHRTAYLFCLLLPFGFADVLGWGTPLIACLVAYTFFGLDALGDELEEPFGEQANALPIGALADRIEIDLREALGETDLPEPARPVNYVLM